MSTRHAITTVLAAAASLLVFCAIVFNREMAVMIESSATLDQIEAMPVMAEDFSAKMDTIGVNPAVDGLRRGWKLFLGMPEE